ARQVAGEVGRAVAVASEPLTVGAGPHEDPAGWCRHLPTAVCLEAVVLSAEGAEVVGGCGAGLVSTFACGVVVEGFGVVEVASASGSGAPREYTGTVAQDYLAAEPVGGFVSTRRDLFVEVDDRKDPHLGV